MNAFDKVIGYDTIKNELLQLCDMIHNRDIYENMGAKLPHGVILYGPSGIGKTLMAKCFIEASGLKSYTVRRNKSDDDFIKEILDTFEIAGKNSPSIVFLDDIDKYSDDDSMFSVTQEYAAVQTAIDDIGDSEVFVIATANELSKLPKSLIRSGRMDKIINIGTPNSKDARKIVEYYLSTKRISKDVNLEDVTKMIRYSSCAELESILNEAAISAAYRRKDCIEIDELVNAVLRQKYDAPDEQTELDEKTLRESAVHEAGHLVVSEVLEEESVGLVSITASGRNSRDGFTTQCKAFESGINNVLILLAGKAAAEMYSSESAAWGCNNDLERAYRIILEGMTESATHGLGLLDYNAEVSNIPGTMNVRLDTAVKLELERCMAKTRDILIKNRDFLDKAAEEIYAKKTLLFSDIRRIRESVKITKVQTY